jgi:hypothetical protein
VSANVAADPAREVASPPPKIARHQQIRASSRGPGVNHHDAGSPATFIFQTLGYVEMQGEMQAIVADGSEVYLVKQGEMFAEKYRATSVDSVLVLAVKASPEEQQANALLAQTESGAKSASNQLYGYLHFPNGTGMASATHPGQDSYVTSFGVNLFNSSTEFDLQSQFLLADNPRVGY